VNEAIKSIRESLILGFEKPEPDTPNLGYFIVLKAVYSLSFPALKCISASVLLRALFSTNRSQQLSIYEIQILLIILGRDCSLLLCRSKGKKRGKKARYIGVYLGEGRKVTLLGKICSAGFGVRQKAFRDFVSNYDIPLQ